jgi:hypothetical protein
LLRAQLLLPLLLCTAAQHMQRQVHVWCARQAARVGVARLRLRPWTAFSRKPGRCWSAMLWLQLPLLLLGLLGALPLMRSPRSSHHASRCSAQLRVVAAHRRHGHLHGVQAGADVGGGRAAAHARPHGVQAALCGGLAGLARRLSGPRRQAQVTLAWHAVRQLLVCRRTALPCVQLAQCDVAVTWLGASQPSSFLLALRLLRLHGGLGRCRNLLRMHAHGLEAVPERRLPSLLRLRLLVGPKGRGVAGGGARRGRRGDGAEWQGGSGGRALGWAAGRKLMLHLVGLVQLVGKVHRAVPAGSGAGTLAFRAQHAFGRRRCWLQAGDRRRCLVFSSGLMRFKRLVVPVQMC